MTNDTREIFVKNLRYYLTERGKSQADVSRDLKIPITTISNWYHGNRYPRPDKMQKLADYLGISMNNLISDDTKYEFSTGEEALLYILEQPLFASSVGYDPKKMSDEQLIKLANKIFKFTKMEIEDLEELSDDELDF
jgi:transcriptional regulator with XRE-family HTH domain